MLHCLDNVICALNLCPLVQLYPALDSTAGDNFTMKYSYLWIPSTYFPLSIFKNFQLSSTMLFPTNSTSACNQMMKFLLQVKGSVSRVLRWVLQYINRMLSLWPIIAWHKILSLSKGQFTIYIKQAGAPLYNYMYGFIETILKSEENVGFRNIEIHNSPFE